MAKIVSLILIFLTINPQWVYAEGEVQLKPSRELVIEYLEISDSYKLALHTITRMMDQLKDSFNKALPNDKKITDETWDSLMEEVKTEIDKDSYYNMLVPMYQKYLTNEDLKHIIDFYKSSAGKKLIEVTPSMLRENGSVLQEWAMKKMERYFRK